MFKHGPQKQHSGIARAGGLGGGIGGIIPFTLARGERWSLTTAVARRSYFTFSLAVKEDEVITVLEWQRGSEVKVRKQMMR